MAAGGTELGGKGGDALAQPASSSVSNISVSAGLGGLFLGSMGNLLLRGVAPLFLSARGFDGAAGFALPVRALLSVLSTGVGVVALLAGQAPGLQRGDGGHADQQVGAELHASPTVAGASPVTRSWPGNGTASGQR